MQSENSVVHFADKLLTDPRHDITISLVGCGGTGSKMLTNLAMINQARLMRGEIGLNVRVFDPDEVTESNVGRQVFSPADIGRNKAEVAVSRINRFYGFAWASVPERYDVDFVRSFWTVGGVARSNITISCTDTLSSRREIKKILYLKPELRNDEEYKPLYWLDCGNMQTDGQVVLSSVGEIKQPASTHHKITHLKDPFELFPELVDQKDDPNVPSCSMRESLARQDLFINTLVANHGANLLWSLLKNHVTQIQGYFINSRAVKPIYLWYSKKEKKDGSSIPGRVQRV